VPLSPFEAAIVRPMAPLKAPRSWPNNSDSRNRWGMAAQLTFNELAIARAADIVDGAGEFLPAPVAPRRRRRSCVLQSLLGRGRASAGLAL